MEKMKNKNHIGFTLAEMMIVFTIIAIITVITVKISKSRTNYETKFQTYAAFMNLRQAFGEIVAAGYDEGGGPSKSIPRWWNTTSGPGYGLCQRLASEAYLGVMNTVGTVNCAAASTTTTFTDTYLNFTTTNGQRFFHSGSSRPYIIFVDINGTKGTGTLNQDVIGFTAKNDPTTSEAKIYPVSTSIAATSTSYLSASVRNTNASNQYVTILRNATFYDATCTATGKYDDVACATPTQNANCTATTPCEVIIDRPGF